MCGRDAQFYTWREIWEFSQPLTLSVPAENPAPNYNHAPSQPGWTIVATERGGEVEQMRWGLIPSWAKDAKIGYSTINARVETADTKPAFRDAFKRRRCLVPASGYYEWKVLDARTKQPYFIHPVNAPVFFFAGLWEQWQAPGEPALRSYSILTRGADDTLGSIHDRQPVMLPAVVFSDWLHGTPSQAAEILHAAEPPAVAFHAVDRAVGNVRNQGAELILPLPAQASLGDS